MTTTLRSASDAYPDARVDILWNGEVVSSAPLGAGLATTTRHPTSAGYVRAHLVGRTGTLLAVTNPVYITLR